MKFYEQFSIGNRVEVNGLGGGFMGLGLGVSDGDRGTVLKKRQGNWLDPVSRYIVEMDYPCIKESIEISGRNLRKVSPESEEAFEHRDLPAGAKVSRSVQRLSQDGGEASASGILLPDSGEQSNWTHLQGVVLKKQPGRRMNEPDSYLVEWDNGETSWHRETQLSAPPRHD